MKDIIQTIEDYSLGFTMITDHNGALTGLSSNADLRRGLLKNIDDLNTLSIHDIVNESPVSIDQEATISELLDLIQHERFLISFLPVVAENNRLTGALTFINLIRSES
jgi:CBS domain-containing protein